MAWCLANQKTISENLQNQKTEKKTKIKDRIAEKEKLSAALEKLRYEEDTRYI